MAIFKGDRVLWVFLCVMNFVSLWSLAVLTYRIYIFIQGSVGRWGRERHSRAHIYDVV